MMHVNDINEGKISPGDGEKECLSVEEGVQENVEESEESSEDSDLKGAMQDELEPKEILAKKETSTVFRLKLIVMLVLLFSAVGVSTGVYFFASRQEESTFETQFTGASNKVLENIGRSIERNLDSFDSVAVTLISFTHNTNKSWPFVTLPNFAVRMSKILPLTNSAYISINPVVAPEHRKEWEQYSLENQFWINETMAFQETWKEYYGPVVYEWTPDPVIHGISGDEPYNISRVLLPMWQTFPVVPRLAPYNFDRLNVVRPEAALACLGKQRSILSGANLLPKEDDSAAVKAETKALTDWIRDYVKPGDDPVEPMSDIYYPIVDGIEKGLVVGAEGYYPTNHSVVGMITASFYWREFIRDVLPPGTEGVVIVIDSPCNDPFTYELMGPNVKYLGVGDNHDPKYDRLGVHSKLIDLTEFSSKNSTYSGARLDEEFCPYTLHVYPSDALKSESTSTMPVVLTVSAVIIFIFTSFVFCFYDLAVERRQKLVMKNATRSSEIVSSLFPSTVRDQLYQAEDEAGAKRNKGNAFSSEESKVPLQLFGLGGTIAELYPETTVMFADIAGFTAWSSVRQPCQVFHLLESLYGAFDQIAKQRGVFKVETIGDSYVAVVGLPTPRKQHAVVMVRFAKDCRNKMNELTRELEITLGPGTAELSLRLGLNSGPTTAGVLRGEKSRFQLFGDTVNTAARMESNGERNRIQVSQKTADLIELAGKGHWLTPRMDKINAKGKGQMQTYWCEPKSGTNSTGSGSEGTCSESEEGQVAVPTRAISSKLERLVAWNVDMFEGLLKKVIAHRNIANGGAASAAFDVSAVTSITGIPIEEVTELVSMPAAVPKFQTASAETQLSPAAIMQLQEFVTAVAQMYPANPFHNFDHCSHVAMSTKKLLDRIALEDCPYGISSDPLTQFALIFGALAHDANHPGVSNAQLVKENAAIAVAYNGKSVAEQNSVDTVWTLLMEERFADLRACIYSNETELKHFRQIVVNIVMATDLFDKDLNALRELRWAKAFSGEHVSEQAPPGAREESNRRATIILDLIMQASDVSHTMQHFTVYKKWNLCLLTEMYDAYKCGRSLTGKDPTDGWYEGELWFFDNYIIPLAKKLKACGVFGVSFDEFLDYAKDNRVEWELTGREIVREAKEAMEARTQSQVGVQLAL